MCMYTYTYVYTYIYISGLACSQLVSASSRISSARLVAELPSHFWSTRLIGINQGCQPGLDKRSSSKMPINRHQMY